MMFIRCIKKSVGVTVSQHTEQHSPEGIHTDHECNSEEITDMKGRQFRFIQMAINEEISNNFGQ